MEKQICLFEDNKVERFLPLVWLNPFLNLRLGISTFFEKWQRVLSGIKGIWVRDYLKDYSRELYKNLKVNSSLEGEILIVNCRINPYQKNLSEILNIECGEGLKDIDGTVISFCVKIENSSNSENLDSLISNVRRWRTIGKIDIFNGLEDLIIRNGDFIKEDFDRFFGNYYVRIPSDLRIIGDDVFIAETSKIHPFVVIDSTEGPVIIDEESKIYPYVYLEGPCYIGKGTLIRPFTKIFKNTTVGPVCKVGGEIESSIFHSFSNKQHDGFLGHSYVSSWVNLGADTVTSDLKNNYSKIRLKYKNVEWDSGTQFIGTFFADHVKTGINTMLNSGTIIGAFTNLFGGDYPPKFIPSFFWGQKGSWQVHDLEKALETAKLMMARRNVNLTDNYRELVKRVFQLTEEERSYYFGK